MIKVETAKKSLWQKTPVANLIRYVPSGVFFARARIRGKLFVKSLKTDLMTIAQLRLSDLLKSERRRVGSSDSAAKGRLNFSDALSVYRERLHHNKTLKPRSKAYREERITALLKSWPGLGLKDLRKISKSDCEKWAGVFGKKSSPTAFNNTIATLRSILAIGVEVGAAYDNPAVFLKKSPATVEKNSFARNPRVRSVCSSDRASWGEIFKRLCRPCQISFIRWFSKDRSSVCYLG